MKSASVEFQKALGLDPQGAKTGLGQQFARLIKADSFEEALNLGRILLELEPKNYVILNHLGNCARHLKLREQADRFYRLCYQIKPDYTKAHLEPNWRPTTKRSRNSWPGGSRCANYGSRPTKGTRT